MNDEMANEWKRNQVDRFHPKKKNKLNLYPRIFSLPTSPHNLQQISRILTFFINKCKANKKKPEKREWWPLR